MKLLDVIWAILRGLFWGIVDDYPFGSSEGPSAEKKERPWWEETPGRPAKEPAADQAAKDQPRADQQSTAKPTTPGWWPEPAPPAAPPTIKVETDAGTFIAATTFSGPNLMGIRRAERPRQEGESRRRRRAREAVVSPVEHVDVELRSREPEVPETATDATSTAVARVHGEGQPREGSAPETGSTAGESSPPRNGPEAAVPIEPAEAPRVARARRVRGRLAATDRGSPRLATTLATRLALAASTHSSPALTTIKEGA